MPEEKVGDPDPNKVRKLAEELINEQNTLTLATCSEKKAWAAPVYYVFMKSAFYFFSDPASRHITEALESGQASGAIHGYAAGWQEIRGIQMTGCIKTLSMGLESGGAIRGYLRKFQFTKEFFSSGMALNLDAFTSRFRVKLYKFEPTLIYYLDNSIRFGFKEQVAL
ncbi:pyridoxamine 5'-phosphate oxidase family protein [delta proteobacterium NaphS2]|nr:pyridoxamine 5'-phosphate oxidase family protein [delta proteobacterium NaphS2]